MGNAIFDMLLKAANTPDPKPYRFQIGQKVRICRTVIHDGQTPHYWAGAVVTVERCRSSMLSKTHGYWLRHDNGALDLFEEDELDARYRRTSHPTTKGPQ